MSGASETVEQLSAFVHQLWVAAFNNGATTSFIMLDYLVREQARIEYSQFLTSWRNFYKGVEARDIMAQEMHRALKRIWAENTGRCTSFTLKIIDLADKEKPGKFEWEIHRLGVHHLARCRKTGILVDSSSRSGVKILPENKWERFNKNKKEWYYAHGMSSFNSGNDGTQIKQSLGPVSKKEALTFCLMNILSDHRKGPNTICYFREFSDGWAKFWGMIRWNYESRCIELIKSLNDQNDHILIEFGRGKDQIDVFRCVEFIGRWIKAYGGAYYHQQWHTAGVSEAQEKLFTSAVIAWGLSRLNAKDEELLV